MRHIVNAVITGTVVLLMTSAVLAGTTRPKNAHLYIISPQDGEAVSGAVTVRFGLRGMGIAPATVRKPRTGHHHLLIDVTKPIDFSKPVAMDDAHQHFGGGQTETTLTLPPGNHRLQLLFADHKHIPHEPPLFSEAITITVVNPPKAKVRSDAMAQKREQQQENGNGGK